MRGRWTNNCRGFSFVPDYRVRTLTGTVPNKCLGDPRWLRITHLEALARGPVATHEDDQRFVDNPYTTTWKGRDSPKLYGPGKA